jgi:hypothetical protein
MPTESDTIAAVEDAVLDRLLPQFIDAAGGDDDLARAMIRDQIDRYQPRSAADLVRVGQAIGLHMSAVGNLRLSMELDQDVHACWQLAESLSKEAGLIVQSLNLDRGGGRARGASRR